MSKVLMAALIALIGVTTARAQAATAPSARLALSSGVVEVQRGNVWKRVGAGEVLNPGERIRTSSGFWAAMEFDPGRVVTLTEGTEIEIRRSNGAPVVQLESGSIKVFAAG